MASQRAEGLTLLALQVFAGISAIAGGIALMTGTIDLPTEWLTGGLFSDYTIPGIILAAIVGGSQFVAIGFAFSRRESYLLATAVGGGILMGWIIGEMIIVASNDTVMFGYQIAYFVIGFLEFTLASFELRKQEASG